MIALERPTADEVFHYYQRYVSKAQGPDLLSALERASDRMHAEVGTLSEERGEYRYAEGKWTIKEVVQHVIDAERIFAYRALRFARNDATPLPGFEENDYTPAAGVGRRTLKDLLREHDAVRTATVELFKSFSPDMLLLQGTANGNRMSVRALGWTIAGHAVHHLDVLNERYR